MHPPYDEFVYPGTSVLINKFDLRDETEVSRRERQLSRMRMRQPPPRLALTPKGFQNIHRHIFQDIYPWAGQYRSCDLSKGGSLFCRPQYLDGQMRELFFNIKNDRGLARGDKSEFSERAACHISELNAIHPFREGNGRASRVLLDQLAERARYALDMEKIKSRWMEATIPTFQDPKDPILKDLIESALSPREKKKNRKKAHDNERGFGFSR